MKAGRSWWLIFAGCCGLVVAALAWVTVTVLRLERAELSARADMSHQENLRLALWRMDSWLAPLLAREASRPYFAYQSFYAQERAYSNRLAPLEPGEVLAPSPLLSFASDYFRLHFQVEPDGSMNSPQAPQGDYRTLAEDVYLPTEQIRDNDQALQRLAATVTPAQIEGCVAAAEVEELRVNAVPPQVAVALSGYETQEQRNWAEASKRKGAVQQSFKNSPSQTIEETAPAAAPDEASVAIGSFVGFWTGPGKPGSDGGNAGELVFSRSVRVGGTRLYQGFLCDWAKLRSALLSQVGDLFAAAQLVPVPGPGPPTATESATMLATLPVRLEPGPAPVSAASILTPARGTLALAWLATLGAVVAVGVTLHSSIAFGRRRSRFASAVTHELRTPLTTFRMYSEMLAEDMVQDPAQRRVYLETLRDESGRLSRLVENVLAYARLEDGRTPASPRPTTLANLLEYVVPPLEKRAASAGMTLHLEREAPGETPLRVDSDAVGQVLFNLVDNACKYAAGASDRTIHLKAGRRDGRLALCVRDHGPGVPASCVRSIFAPFDRGHRDAADPVPGVGLGLALARGLARDLGGDLVCSAEAEGGACFRFTLPVEKVSG